MAAVAAPTAAVANGAAAAASDAFTIILFCSSHSEPLQLSDGHCDGCTHQRQVTIQMHERSAHLPWLHCTALLCSLCSDKYTPVQSPLPLVLEWQRSLCARLGLKGRVRLASEGINATLAGSAEGIQEYIRSMNSEGPSEGPHAGHALFADIAYKFSTSDRDPFDALGMFLVSELTASGKMGKSKPPGLQQPNVSAIGQPAAVAAGAADSDAAAVSGTGAAVAAADGVQRSSSLHLTPREFHDAISSFDPSTTLLLDTRNAYETAIGMFSHAVDPKLRAFHQLPEYISMNLEAIRAKKTVLMYCTGGIRCEKASLYLAHRAPNTRVLQLEGGIHKYLDEFPDGGHFVGANMVFDGRLAMASQDPTVLGKCVQCAAAYDKLDDKVLCDVCKSFVLLCDGCRDLYGQKGWRVYCAEHILLAAAAGAPEAEDPKHKGRMTKRARTEAHAPPSAASTAADPAAAASSADAVPAASSGSHAAADADADAAGDGEGSVDAQAAADSVGCPEQWQSFLRRFRTSELEAQLAEMDAILAFFAQPKQKKTASKSRNRKANLHIQRRRLQAYIDGRRAAEAANQTDAAAPAADASAADAGSTAAADAPAISAAPAAPELLSFVPFLNV